MRSIFAAMLVAALAACSTSQVHLRHESKVVGSAEYEEDVSACRIYANSAAPMIVTSGHGPQRNIDDWTRHFYSCMRDKGWEAVDDAGKSLGAVPRSSLQQIDSRDALLNE
jgi:hypothetical protein